MLASISTDILKNQHKCVLRVIRYFLSFNNQPTLCPWASRDWKPKPRRVSTNWQIMLLTVNKVSKITELVICLALMFQEIIQWTWICNILCILECIFKLDHRWIRKRLSVRQRTLFFSKIFPTVSSYFTLGWNKNALITELTGCSWCSSQLKDRWSKSISIWKVVLIQ